MTEKNVVKKLLDVKGLSEYLSVSTGSIYVKVCRKEIPAAAIVKLGKSLRFKKEEVDLWIDGLKKKTDCAEEYLPTV